MSELKKQYDTQLKNKLMEELGLDNSLACPQPLKITVNMGIGVAKEDPKLLASFRDDLKTITGQQPAISRAKKAEAGFKIRAGDPIGLVVTLRGMRMWNFLEKLIHIDLPRVRDFHGVSRKSFDGRGNYNLGITEHIVFPEINPNKVDRIKTLGINITTNAGNDEEGYLLLKLLGWPFAKE